MGVTEGNLQVYRCRRDPCGERFFVGRVINGLESEVDLITLFYYQDVSRASAVVRGQPAFSSKHQNQYFPHNLV